MILIWFLKIMPKTEYWQFEFHYIYKNRVKKAMVILPSMELLLLKGTPLLIISLSLLIINKIFLHLLLRKQQTPNRRKFIFKICQETMIYQLFHELLNDWKTYKNTMKNSLKLIPEAEPMVKRKSVKSVKFIHEDDEEVVFCDRQAPVSLKAISSPQEWGTLN